MSAYLGDFTPGKTIRAYFDTFDPTGAPVTMTSITGKVYKDGSTTESGTGLTITANFDGRTGMHLAEVDTSADGTFYAAGSDFAVVLVSATVNGIAVLRVLAHFSLSNRSALRPATAGRELVVDGAGLADANTVKVGPSGSGTAQTAGDIPARLPAALTANGNMKSSLLEIITTALSEGAAGRIAAAFQTMFNVASSVFTTASVNQTGDTYARLGAPAGASVSADIAANATSLSTILSRIPSGIFTGMTSLAQWLGLLAGKQTGNSTARTEVRATGAGSGTFDETTDSIEALRDNVGTNGAALSLAKTTNITGFNDLSAAQVNAEADTALADVGVTGTVTGRIDAAISSRAVPGDAMALTSSERTTLTAAVWNALTSGLTTVGSIGKWIVDKLDVVLSTRLATSGYTAPLDAAGTRAAIGLASANLDTQLDALPTNSELATALAAADDAVLAAIAALSIPTANQNADALLDRTDAIETAVTIRKALRGIAAATFGKASGLGTSTATYRNAVQDSKDRIVATVDTDGNRTAVTTDLT